MISRNTSSLIILFGLPGVGKTYTGELISERFDYYFYDGDQELTHQLKFAIYNQQTVTDRMRDEFFQRIINRIKTLQCSYKKIVLAQMFIKEKYREWILNEFPEAKLILIFADSEIRELRLQARREFSLHLNYARKMVANFDVPHIPHQKIINNMEGKTALITQLNTLF